MSLCRLTISASVMIAMMLPAVAPAATESAGKALLAALRDADEAKAARLIGNAAAVKVRDESGATPLMWAVQRGSLDQVTRLLQAGADPNQRDTEGFGPLQLALGLRLTDIALLLIESGADANTARDNGETVLMTAARTGQLQAMKRLIDRGANVNARERKFRQTALMWSAGYPQQTRLLLAHGADAAARTRVWNVTQTIYSHLSDGVGPYSYGGEYSSARGGQSALHFAVQQDDIDSVEALLDAGVDVNDRAADGSTALLLALYKWNEGGKRYGAICNDSAYLISLAPNVAIANLLLDRGAQVNVADTAGYTPLHAAVLALVPRVRMDKCRTSSNRTEYSKYPHELVVDRTEGVALVRRLLDEGADPNAMTRYPTPGPIGRIRLNPAPVGSAPVHIAAESADAELLKLLLERGADPNVVRSDGHSPLSLAVRADDLQPVRILLAGGVSARSTFNPADFVIDEIGPGGAITAMSTRRDQTLLHIAAATGSHSVIALLGQHGVLPSATNDKGETALALAQTQERFRYRKEVAALEAEQVAKRSTAGDANSVVPDTRTSDAIQRLMKNRRIPTEKRDSR